ncbi:MAG: threonylcarbamoyl-AMP synthase [Candidatus Eremiobacteraeota bacterium]|nr:threonylcarbamoyl-AMP synthase [Candidatus Eremiobacteraeota bacterium]
MRTLDSRRFRAAAVADAVATVVLRGGVVIFPTDTVYGIGCDPMQAAAVERIFTLKNRSRTKPLSLHFSPTVAMLEYAPGPPLVAAAAGAFFPGPLTLIVRRPAFVSQDVTAGLPSVGLRVPKHELCRTILDRCGPLAATSANISGSPAFNGTGSHGELPAAELWIDDGPTPLGAESTIIDVTGKMPRLIREGAISVTMLEQVLGRIDRSEVLVTPPGEPSRP